MPDCVVHVMTHSFIFNETFGALSCLMLHSVRLSDGECKQISKLWSEFGLIH